MDLYSVQYRTKDPRPGAGWVVSQESVTASSPSHAEDQIKNKYKNRLVEILKVVRR